MSAPAQLRKCVQNYYETRRLYSGHHIERESSGRRVRPGATMLGEYTIPDDTYEYRLGYRSALEWVVDQYQAKGGSNPNREDDPEYIVRQLGELPFRED